MTNLDSDAFVFFGVTGDLAYKQIFPALQAMIRAQSLRYADYRGCRSPNGLEHLQAHAHESLKEHGDVDVKAFVVLSQSSSMLTATTATNRHSAIS